MDVKKKPPYGQHLVTRYNNNFITKFLHSNKNILEHPIFVIYYMFQHVLDFIFYDTVWNYRKRYNNFHRIIKMTN